MDELVNPKVESVKPNIDPVSPKVESLKPNAESVHSKDDPEKPKFELMKKPVPNMQGECYRRKITEEPLRINDSESKDETYLTTPNRVASKIRYFKKFKNGGLARNLRQIATIQNAKRQLP